MSIRVYSQQLTILLAEKRFNSAQFRLSGEELSVFCGESPRANQGCGAL